MLIPPHGFWFSVLLRAVCFVVALRETELNMKSLSTSCTPPSPFSLFVFTQARLLHAPRPGLGHFGRVRLDVQRMDGLGRLVDLFEWMGE